MTRYFLLLLGSFLSLPVAAQPPGSRSTAWTRDEALHELAYRPNDPYLQYVAVQLARRDGKADETARMIDQASGRTNRGNNPRGRRADLFSTFTGAVAIQENLQLDTMTGARPDRAAGEKKEGVVKVSTLTGPTVQSHPWEKLLGARTTDVGPLAAAVPHDFYFAEFRSVAKLHDATTTGNVWGNHVFTQVLGQSRSQLTIDRAKAQLGLGVVSPAVIDRLGVEAVAVTGSDLFVSEGSDLTVLVRGKNVVAVADALAKLSAGKIHREDGTHAGIAYSHQWTDDGTMNAYIATPHADLHVRGNSLLAFRRVLEAIGGSTKRLGETAEYRYVRSLMPRGGPDEDGFVYLSDAFIRHMVGPQLKLTERRRLIAYTHLRMIGHACLMFRTEFGRAPQSLEELADKKCAPGVFGRGDLAHPAGGTYTLAADAMTGICSVYGTAAGLTPCIECRLSDVSREEADEYQEFVKEYQQYWRTYFDPIAVRVRVTPEQLRLETLVLPLIDNSFYTELARMVGGKPVVLDTLPTPKSCIGSVVLQVNKEPFLDALGPAGEAKAALPANRISVSNNLKQVGLAMHNYHDAYAALPTPAVRDKNGKALLSWRVAILPFVEEGELYKQFRLDEPWDSAHNKKLIPKMPKAYACSTKAVNDAGKTTCLLPVGKGTLFPPDGKGTKFGDNHDGLSNTVMAVLVGNDRAVEWTKPEDWPFDPKAPTKDLAKLADNTALVLLGDGDVQPISLGLTADHWAALFTSNGGEKVDVIKGQNPPAGRNAAIDMLPPEFLAEIDADNLRRFLKDGIGDQVGVHMFDESRLIDFDFSGVLGGTGGAVPLSQRDRLGISLLVQALIRPTAISVPVKDAKLVDEMIAAYDRWTVATNTKLENKARMWLPIDSEFYRVQFPAPHTIRCSTYKIMGFKIRVFWGRIGDGFYVANRPFVLEDIAAAHADAATRKPQAEVKANAVLRIRPENWNRVLPGYRLGWAENDRAACHTNLGLLANVGRGWNDREPAVDAELLRRVGQVYGTRPVCPEGGRYAISPDGRACECAVHGSRTNPTQPAVPTDASPSGKLMNNLSGVTATLIFQDDGLRAVVTVDRKPK